MRTLIGGLLDTEDEQLIRSAYLTLRAAQDVTRAVALKTLGPASNHAFTIDGKLLGDLGELVACIEFGLTPAPTGTKGIDAYTLDHETVEVKSTAGSRMVYIPGNGAEPDHLVVVSFDAVTGDWQFIYFGRASRVWQLAKHSISPGRQLSLSVLTTEQSRLEPHEVLPRAARS